MSIPGEYTSFLAPISSSKLYNEVRACREKDRDPEVKSCFSSRSDCSLVFSTIFSEADEGEREAGVGESGCSEAMFLVVSLMLELWLPLSGS